MHKKQSKRMSRRDFLRVSAMSTAGMLAAACVQPAPVAQEVVEEAPAMPEAMEFTLLSLDGVGWNEANTVLIEAFEEKTGHKGKLWGAGWPMNDTLLPAIAAGAPPDVYHDMPLKQAELYANGTAMTLNDHVEASPWNPEDLSPVDMQACTWFGKIKQMPLWHDLSGQSFYVYRTDFFDEAGIPHPARHGGLESYDQLHDVAQKLTQRDASGNVSRWGWYRALSFQVLSKVLDEGEHWWDEENQEFTLTNDAFIKWINKLYFEPLELGISPNEEQTPDMSDVEMMTEGAVAMTDRFFTLHIAEDAGRSEAEVMNHMQSPPTFEGQPDADRHFSGWGGWSCGIPSSIASDRLQGAFDLATAQYNPDVARAFHRFVGPPGALKSYANDPYLDELYEETVYGGVTVDMYRWQVTHPGVFFGWEWGNLNMPNWPGSRCSGGAYVGDSEEAAAARCDRGSWVSGKYTAEELAEEWQEWATRVRKEWYESIDVEV